MSIRRPNHSPVVELNDNDDSDIIIVDAIRKENRVLEVITLDDDDEKPVKKAEPEVITLEDDDDEAPPTPRAAEYPLPSPSVSIPVGDSSAMETPPPTSDIADLATSSPEGTPAVQATPKSRRQAPPRARAQLAPESVAPGTSARQARTRRTQLFAPEAEKVPDAEAQDVSGLATSTRRERGGAARLRARPSTSEAAANPSRARGAR